MIIFLIGGLLLAWKTGILESIRSGATPETGRECYIDGPQKAKGVTVAIDPESLGREIDTHVGVASSERLAHAMGLKALFESGELAMVPPHTKVRVIENGSVTLDNLPCATVKVKLLEGTNKNAEVWVERANLIDTPIQSMIQSLRQQHTEAPAKGTAK
jgi:hypothetical protein